MSLNRLKIIVLGGMAASVLVSSASAWALLNENEPRSSTALPKSYADEFQSLGNGMSDDEAVQKVAQGLDDEVIYDIRLGEAPVDVARSGRWMYAHAAGSGPRTASWMLSFWEANLAQGAIADLLADTPEANLANVISGSTVTLEDKSQTPLPTDAGDVAAGQLFLAQGGGWSDDEISARVDGILSRFGLAAKEVRVLRPLGPAVQIVASIENQKLVEGRFNSLQEALQEGGNYEGIYIELWDAEGSPIAISASAYRSGGGGVWFETGYDAVLGLGHGASLPVGG